MMAACTCIMLRRFCQDVSCSCMSSNIIRLKENEDMAALHIPVLGTPYSALMSGVKFARQGG